MPIAIEAVTAEQVSTLLSIDEGHFGDVKAIEVAPGKLTETIAAFANADGGELYIGIDEDKLSRKKSWRGFSRVEDANGHIQAFEHLFPLGQDFDYAFLSAKGEPGLVLQILVRKTAAIKRASDGAVYLRRGAQKLKLTTPESIQRLERAKGITSFETEVVGVSHQVITNTIEIIEFMLQVVPKAEPEVWLRKQQLIQGEKPTVCGVLLFADEPQAILPKRSGVKIYRYRTVEGSGARDTLDFDPITVEGTSYKQIRAAVEQTIKVIQDIPVAGRLGLEAVKYPTDTIHEIVTNAVIHRDYSIADDIHVRIFDNRVEVESPGRLPAHVTPENILDERFARNGNLVRLLNKYPTPPNKDVGEGLNTAFEAMRKLGLKEPIIQNREHSVLVTIRHERLASAEEVILEYLEKQDSITNKKARGLCHFDADHKVRRIFQRLEDWKLIEKVPGTQLSTTAYRKGAKFKEWRSRLSSKTRT